MAIAENKCHFHCKRCIHDSQHKGNPDFPKDSDEIKKAWGKAAGLGLGSPKGIAPSPQHATGAALLALHGLGFLFQRNSSGLSTQLPAWLVHPGSDPAAAGVGFHTGLHAFTHPSPWISPVMPREAHKQPLRPGGHRHPGPISKVLRTTIVEGKPAERYPHCDA